MTTGPLSRAWMRWALTGGIVLAALVAVGLWWSIGGSERSSDGHVHTDAAAEATDHYLLQVLLGDASPIDAAHDVAVNADGLIAAIIDPRGDDRPRVVYTEGVHAPQDVSRRELLRRTDVSGLQVDRRGNIIHVAEHTRAGVTRRRTIQWGVFIGGQVRVLADAVWDEEGLPVGDRTSTTGRHPGLSDAGPALAIADLADGADRATFHLRDPRGDDAQDLEIVAPLHEDPLRPAIADSGLIVVSTGDRLVGVETGIGRPETLAEAPSGSRIGRAPAISADGRVVVFFVEDDQGRTVHALRRGSHGWIGPAELDTRVRIEDVDEAPAVGSQRHPPEIGDVGFLALRGTYAGSDDRGLWSLVLEDDDRGALRVAEIRPVTLAGTSIVGRTITDVRPDADLAVPRTPLVGQPDAHWIAFIAETEDGPLVVRGVPAGSGLEREARLPDQHDH